MSKFNFSQSLIHWQKKQGRHHLPWQKTRDAYRIWLSEVMLQQTQVSTVITYYERFLHHFPDIAALARAPSDEVMALWAGLGYYSRARNLHRCAQTIVEHFAGRFPNDLNALQNLPGIGRSTAAAISAFAYGTRAAILDGNVKRVLTRIFGIDGYPGLKPVETQLWQLAESLLPANDIEAYTQGLMDFGATLCKRSNPICLTQAQACPFAAQCIAHTQNRTAELPTRKPSKALPWRAAAVLVLTCKNAILLQKRPALGIWGGLWSLPQLEIPSINDTTQTICEADKITQDCLASAQTFGIVKNYQQLPAIKHTFTHFHLRLFPILIELETQSFPNSSYPYRSNNAKYSIDSLNVAVDFEQAPLTRCIAEPLNTKVWVTAAQLSSKGMPAPIKRLVGKILIESKT